MKHQMAFGWSLFQVRGLVNDNPEELKKFIHNGIVDLIVHEMGHVLGLRHNFESSSTIELDKLTDKDFTNREGISGSVMDYNAINVSPKGEQQGNPFQTVLGPYDYWVIEYAYKPLDPDSKTSEKEMLEKIAERGTDPRLQYGTDEDAFGLSTRGIDPHCNLWDLGNDPLGYYSQRMTMSQELWELIPDQFEQKAERYQKFRLIFGQGLTEYVIAAANMAKYVGGIYSNRDHIDDPDGRPPFQMVQAEKQRKALHLLTENFFAPNSFKFSPDLLNKLAPEFFWDFEGTPFRRLRIDYPIHGMVQLIQASALFRLYDPINLQRMQDNEVRFPENQKPFTMAEMFGTLREAVWQELQEDQNINSFRRELQRMHLFVLNRILLQSPSILPHDAISLARNDMVNIAKAIDRAFSEAEFDSYTAAHLEETRAKIKAALDAQLERSY
jgi:hypothetical protein